MAKKRRKIKGTVSHKEHKKAKEFANDLMQGMTNKMYLNAAYIKKIKEINNG